MLQNGEKSLDKQNKARTKKRRPMNFIHTKWQGLWFIRPSESEADSASSLDVPGVSRKK